MYKVRAVKYPRGHIRSYSTISEPVLVLQKLLSRSMMRKFHKQFADLPGSLSITANVLVFGWLTNRTEGFLPCFWESLPENKWGGGRWLEIATHRPIFWHHGKSILFWDHPSSRAHLGSKVQIVKILTNVKRISSTREEMPSRKKGISKADWQPAIMSGGVWNIWDALFLFSFHRVTDWRQEHRTTEVTTFPGTCHALLLLQFFFVFFFFFTFCRQGHCIVPFINELNSIEKWCRCRWWWRVVCSHYSYSKAVQEHQG